MDEGEVHGSTLHPFIQGLVQELPTPNSNWPTKDRVRWLQAATNIFPLIYSDESEDSETKISISQEGDVSLSDNDVF